MSTNVCLTCSHSQVDEIDADLRNGVSALATSKKFGLKYDTVKRHVSKGHVERVGTRAEPLPPGATPAERMRKLADDLTDQVADPDISAAMRERLAGQLRQALASWGKMAGPQAPPEVNIAESDEWVEVRVALTRILQKRFPDAWAAVREYLEGKGIDETAT